MIFSFYALFFSACKDPEEIGLEVQPTSDQLHVLFTDTATLFTKTVMEDSLPSNGVIYQLLGSYTDPVFGRSDASFYTQVALGLSPVLGAATDTFLPDSLILALRYAGYYGDISTTSHVVHVYRIGEEIKENTAYYTNADFYYDAFNDLANSYTYKVRPNDSVLVSPGKQPAQLRIPLSMALASELLSLNGKPQFASNTNWIQYFRGLYLKTEPVYGIGKGAISYFDLFFSPYSKLILYFHNVSTNTHSHYDFSLATFQQMNHQEHAYNGTDVGHQLLDSTWKDSLNYLQAMAGVKTKITFPFLKHFIDSGNILINKAELEITVQPGSADTYGPPAKLILRAIGASGKDTSMTDFFEGASYFGGSFNSETQTYKFNIARHLQKILDGKIDDNGFHLAISGAVVQAKRVIIGSGKNANYPMKLNLFYTKLH